MSAEQREPEKREFAIRRILVAIDASLRSLAALEAAADLAAQLHAELLGLFVEDIDLLRLAGTPAAIHCVYPSASDQPLRAGQIECELRALAERARRELAGAAERAHVPWSFRTVRGQVAAEVLLAAAEADLLTLGEVGRSIARRLGLGSTARAAIAGARSSLLLVQGRIPRMQPVLAAYDRSPGAAEACRFAAHLAESTSGLLTVFLTSPSGWREPAIEAEVARLLAGMKLHVRFHWLESEEKQLFLRAVQSEHGGVLVIGGQSSYSDEQLVEKLLHQTSHPLLILGTRSNPVLLTPPE
ncbi:MAG: universal stress protein [Acidobacteriota bacterium]|nr:universal stress protein [Acidobacteriota bacterium]